MIKNNLAKSFYFIRSLVSITPFLDPLSFLFFIKTFLFSLPAILKSRSLRGFYQKVDEGGGLKFRVLGQKFYLGSEYLGYAKEIYSEKVYFLLPEFRISKGMTVVDLGANIGTFAILASKLAKRVFAVEGDPLVAENLLKWKEKNGAANIEVVQGIIGGGSGYLGQSEKLQFIDEKKSLPQITMRSLLEDYRIDNIDFLKIDIEGSEFDLFRRDFQWLSRTKLIAMEVHALYEVKGSPVSFGDAADIEKLLKDNNFQVWLFDSELRPVSKIGGAIGYLFAKNLRFSEKGS